jgi:hypothetical protein
MWYSDTLGTFNRARPFTSGGVSYPAKVFQSPSTLASLTIYPVTIVTPDSRYYTQGAETKVLANDMWTFTYAGVEKDLETLRGELVTDWLTRLDTTLAPTDKFLTRSDEMAQFFSKWVINPLLQAWRDDVYLKFNVQLNGVTEALTFQGLIVADESPIDIPPQPVPYEVETSTGTTEIDI